MSTSTLVLMQPPSTDGQTFSQVHLGAGVVLTPANTSGQFNVPANFVGTLLAQGWQFVIATPTNVPLVPST